MRVELARPDLLAGRGVDRVGRRGAVGEEHGKSRGAVGRLVGCHRHRRANAGLRVVAPVRAAGLGVEREHVAALAPHEDAAAEHRGLRARRAHTCESERPLQLHARHHRRGDAAGGSGDVARIGNACAPAVPAALQVARPHRRRRGGAAALGGQRRRGAHRTAGDEARHGTALGIAQRRTLPEHVAADERGVDRLGRNLGEHRAVGRARIGGRILVAGGARLLEHGGTVGRLRAGRRDERTQRDEGGNTHSDWFHGVLRVGMRAGRFRVWAAHPR